MRRIFLGVGAAVVGAALAACGGGSSSLPAAGPGQARTQQGIVQGAQIGGLTIFKGIPYAAPPIGNLRWKPPQAPASWSGVKQTVAFGNDCEQPAAFHSFANAPALSEDCLYLNVWTPSTSPGASLPVDVWIYGGGFEFGSAANPEYDGTAFANAGIVFVSFSYRTGIMGFLTHPGLDAESPEHTSGDYGIQDQIAALQWVHANIRNFGGDPSKVTIQGESAGASAVDALLTSPLTPGLFRAAIEESPPAWGPAPTSQAKEATMYASLSAIPIATLRGYTYTQLFGAGAPPETIYTKDALGGALEQPYYTTIDGYVLTDQDYHVYERAQERNVALLVGNNGAEGLLFCCYGTIQSSALSVFPPGSGVSSDATLSSYLQTEFGSLATSAQTLYPDDAAQWPYTPAIGAVSDLFGDGYFNFAARQTARSMVQLNGNVYRYLFEKVADNSPAGTPPPIHGAEIPYVFGTLSGAQYGAGDQQMAAAMQAAWQSFIKTGSPAGGIAGWTAYNANDPLMQLGAATSASATMIAGWRNAQLDLIGEWLSANHP